MSMYICMVCASNGMYVQVTVCKYVQVILNSSCPIASILTDKMASSLSYTNNYYFSTLKSTGDQTWESHFNIDIGVETNIQSIA